jgi:phage terminase large subunit-like protein
VSQTEQHLDEYLTCLKSINADVQGRQVDKFYATYQDREDYSEHLDIFAAGKQFRERFASGGNRTGKSTLGSAEVSYHLTGEYPDWWPGHRFSKPTRIWAAGETRESVREVCQRKLCGPAHDIGSCMIPRDCIVNTTPRQGTPGGLDTVQVKHVSGGISTLSFRTYSEGRGPWQGVELDFLWCDEEPPEDVHSEGMMRLMMTETGREAGKFLLTATPMKPFSKVVGRYLEGDHRIDDGDRYVNFLTWDATPHLTDDEKEEYLKTIPKHEVDARTRGIPMMGAAGIYQFRDKDFIVEPFEIPAYWMRGYGFDVGWRATAAVWIAMNPDTGQHFIYDEYKVGELEPIKHAGVIRAKSKFLTGAIDPASKTSGQKDGVRLLDEYRDQGLKLILADNAVHAGIDHVRMMIATDKLKMFSTCTKTAAEARQYAYLDSGKVRKVNDHLMDAMRYLLMTPKAMRLARPWVKPKVNTSMNRMRRRSW